MTSSVRVVGGWSSTRDAEHGYREADGVPAVGPAYVGTTFGPVHRVVVHLAEHLADLPDRTRLFVFPGHDGLVGTVTVREVLRTTAIDEVRGLAGTFPSLDDRLDTQEFVRPVVERGSAGARRTSGTPGRAGAFRAAEPNTLLRRPHLITPVFRSAGCRPRGRTGR